MSNGEVKIVPYDGYGAVSFEGTQIVWYGTNEGTQAAEAGEIIDDLTLTPADGSPPWQLQAPVNEPVEPGSSYTNSIQVEPLPPVGDYELMIRFNGSDDVVIWWKVTVTEDGFVQGEAL